MLKKIDSSTSIIKLLERLSTLLAQRRGLPVVVGICMLTIGFVLELLSLSIDSQLLELMHTILRNGGVLIALIGLLLAEPLGE